MRIKHGVPSTYRQKGCRCNKCTKAHAEACEASRLRATGRPVPNDKHGTLQGYNYYGCRCDPCRYYKSDYYRSLAKEHKGE